MENMVRVGMANAVNTETANNIPLRSLRRGFKNVNRSKRENKSGERRMKTGTPRKNQEALKVIANINPDQEARTVQPTTEDTKNLQTFPSLLLPNPSMSKSFQSLR
jgi:hypothetical protein